MAVRRNKRKNSSLQKSRRLTIQSLETRSMLAATVRILENINLTNPWASIKESVAIGSNVYFVSQDHGRTNLELWKTDGTTVGTSRLANLGPEDNLSRELTNVNGNLFFRGYDAIEGFELWKSNGTVTGTAIVRSLKPGLASSTLRELTNFNGTLFFSGNGELFKSNGSSTGTTRVKDLIVGASDEVSQLEPVGNTLFFTAKHPGVEGSVSLYRTTGTNSGTTLVDSVASSSLTEVTRVGSGLFFARNGNELWKFDPATSSTTNVFTSFQTSRFQEFVDFQGTLYFTENGTPTKSDGTASGTTQLPINEPGFASSLFATNNFLFFSFGEQGLFGSGNGEELWRTDGTVAGTIEVKDINPRFNEGYGYGSYPNSFIESGGQVFFQAFDGNQTGLWKTDGSEAGTTLIEQSTGGPIDANGQLYFSRFDANNVHLQRLPAGQSTSIEIKRTGPGYGNSNPSATVLHDGSLYFFADDGVTGNELRRRNSDGSVDLVADITPGLADTNVLDMESVNDLLYITVRESGFTSSLWRSDGTSIGTFKLTSAEVTLSASDSNAPKFVPVNESVFFTAFSSTGVELWKSDGSVSGTILVKDIYPGSTYNNDVGFLINSSFPRELTNLNGTLFFSAFTPSSGRELWKSDGTTTGTVLFVDHRPGGETYYPYGTYSSYPSAIRNINGKLHYFARNETGTRLFESDGTNAGMVAVSAPVPSLVFAQSSKQIGEKLFFVASSSTGFGQLWTSDGTTAGTFVVKDVRSGNYPERISNMTEHDGILYFTADDGIHGNELWKSDGTAAGTKMVRDTSPGLINDRPADSDPSDLTSINGVLFFTAKDGNNGRAFWRTNGSAGGATRITGNGTSNPSDLVKLGNRLAFSGGSTLGRELFQLFSSPPVLTLGTVPVVYREGQQAKSIAPNAVLTDVDSAVLRGGRLTVAIRNDVPGDELRLTSTIPLGIKLIDSTVQNFGIVFANLSPQSTSTSLVFDLNQNATLRRVQLLVRAIGFVSTSQDTLSRDRNVLFTLTDGESAIMRRNTVVQVVPVNDAPLITGLAAANYRRNDTSGVAFAVNANVTDVDSPVFDGGQLSISVTGGDVANNRIYLASGLFSVDASGNLRRGAVVIGMVANGSGIGTQPYVVQFNSSARSSTVTDLLKALRFGTLNSTSNQLRSISLSLSDGDGGIEQGLVRVAVTT